MSNIHVIGSAFRDCINILKGNHYYYAENDGGIFNLIETLPQAKFWVTDKNESAEVINKFGRDGQVTRRLPGSGTDKITSMFEKSYKDSDWIHFAYLNSISGNLDVSKFNSKMKSCDISATSRDDVKKEDVLRNVAACDVTFISDEAPWLEDIIRVAKRLIYHGKIEDHHAILVTDKGKFVAKKRYEKENFIFTLGAGDRLAGYYIEAYQNKVWSTDSSIKFAHEQTLAWLKEVNEKI